MNTIERITQLVAQSKNAPFPEVDVRNRVRETIRGLAPEVPALFDTPALVFAGLSLAIMLTMYTVTSPTLSALHEPWAAYLKTPWSF